MVGVFAIFATLPILDMKEMGIGLAAAVLIDATIVRGGAPARDDEAARRLELVPAEVARVAAPTRARDPRSGGSSRGGPGPRTGRLALHRSFASKRPGLPGRFSLKPRELPEAGGGTRTHGLALTRRLLYQLSYSGAPSS